MTSIVVYSCSCCKSAPWYRGRLAGTKISYHCGWM